MKKIKELIDFFYPNKELEYLDYLKTRFFIISLLLGVLLVIGGILNAFMNMNENFMNTIISQIFTMFIIFGTLFLIKKIGYQKAGNIFSLVMIIMIAFFVIQIKSNTQVLYKYVQGFYTVLAILAASVMFADRKTIIIETIIILISTTSVFLNGKVLLPEYKDLLAAGYSQHIIITFLIAIVMYFASKFNESAIAKAKKNDEINKNQNLQLTKMFGLVSETSKKLDALAHNISKSTVSLSKNAFEHAASLQELSATTEELSQSIASNAEYTQNTVESVKKTANLSIKSGDIIKNTLTSV